MDRDEILEALRSCAAADGGKAPGRERFQRDTGIKESDWLGRYWVRWSDLVRDAGFDPQKMNASYDDDYILGHLAKFVGELGRWPTIAEMKLRRRSDPTFPHPAVFDRFNGKAGKAAALLAYSELRDLAEVATICSPLTEPDFEGVKSRSVARVVGYVYLVRSGRYHKIGRSNSLGRRFYELSIQLPERAALVHSIETDDPEGIERYWHQRFNDRRANGEWFRLEAEDIAAFRRRRYM